MKILQVHNAYQHVGGEEVVVAAEHAMLKQYGHDVQQWIVENSAIQNLGAVGKAGVALQSLWSTNTTRQIKTLLRQFQPDVVHVHNTIPRISPSVYAACQRAGVPVIHTLHNYKLICPGAYMYRNGSLCNDCIGKQIPFPSIAHRCYRGSRSQTAISAAGLVTHRVRGTYVRDVDIYIALNRFARQQFIDGGLPAEKIAVKPNFVSSSIEPGSHTGGYALFVGKLVQYKGIETLLKAWHLMPDPMPLKIVGQGPLEILLKGDLPEGVDYLGKLPREEVLRLMQNAAVLIFPSEWYEPFGMVAAEAFAAGLPVIASRLGGIPELVRDGISGWLFNPGDAQDLAQTVQTAWADPVERQRRGALARKQSIEQYSVEKNYQTTLSIYETAIAWAKGRDTLTVF
jgi:glycosyltransferase involved in cell wall biosynthesis